MGFFKSYYFGPAFLVFTVTVATIITSYGPIFCERFFDFFVFICRLFCGVSPFLGKIQFFNSFLLYNFFENKFLCDVYVASLPNFLSEADSSQRIFYVSLHSDFVLPKFYIGESEFFRN